jgi:hypothetical protein
MAEVARDNKGMFKPGHKRLGGRQPGTANKVTQDAREAINLVFEEMGGTQKLLEYALENPGRFYETVWIKVLPRELKADVNMTDFTGILERARARVINGKATSVVGDGA